MTQEKNCNTVTRRWNPQGHLAAAQDKEVALHCNNETVTLQKHGYFEVEISFVSKLGMRICGSLHKKGRIAFNAFSLLV